MDQPGEPKLHVDQSVLQDCKMILQDVHHVLPPVHITPRAEEVLLHAGNDDKSHVNTWIWTLLHKVAMKALLL